MDNLLIPKGKFTPEIQFLNTGILSIQGRSLMKYSSDIFTKASHWMLEYDKKAAPSVVLNIVLEALDTASVRSMVGLVRVLNGFKNTGQVTINWFYEKFDEDLMDIGSAIKHLSKVEFNLVELTEKL